MIDLHMHTTYSDGTESCTTVLKKCQEKNLNYISITDHNTALAYEELEKLDVKSLFSGKIIPGIELNTKALNIPIEILGYGIDYQKMNELVKDVYIPATERNKIEAKRLYDKCIQAGIILDKNCLDNYKPEMFASVFFHNEITKHEENRKYFKQKEWDDIDVFYNSCVTNKKFPVFVDFSIHYPKADVVAGAVRKAGGKTFVAHVFRYCLNDSIGFLDVLKQNNVIDGVEAYHSSFLEEQTKTLKKYCRDNNLFMSGGSDCHGDKKADRKIGIGYGNLNIDKEILKSWFSPDAT